MSLRRRRKKFRKQRVHVRQRHRQESSRRARSVMIRGIVLAVLAGVGLEAAVHGNSFFYRFMERHIPSWDVRAPQFLSGLPLSRDMPAQRFWLWCPWVTMRLASQWKHTYTSVRHVEFERSWRTNEIHVRLTPRTPLVRWRENGFDDEGILFPITPGTWNQLPQAQFSTAISKPEVGRWLQALSQQTLLWRDVAGVRDDGYGTLLFDLRSGAQVVWGAPNVEHLKDKIDLLRMVLDDAHEHLGGMGRADLRFFDEGRIMVLPKAVKS